MVRHNIECCVPTRKLSAGRSSGRTDDLGSQAVVRFAVLVIEFELDPQFNFRLLCGRYAVLGDRSFPVHRVEEYVVSKVLGLDETKLSILLNEHDLAETTALNSESFLDSIV